MGLYGWVGKVAWIDLTSRTVRTEDTEAYTEWIGGRGLSDKILFDHLPQDIDALSPENIIIIATGPLTGTLSPASARINISSKNALTGGYASANAGGFWGTELKMAGFDALIVIGASEKPVFLYIHERKIRVLPAEKLWGLTTSRCCEELKKSFHDNRVSVLCIGPGGENKCRIANVVVDNGRSASYGGIGAILGSKKLKAIVVNGTLPIPIWNSKSLEREAKILFKKILESKSSRTYRKYGTLIAVPPGVAGEECYVVRNYQDGIWNADKALKINPIVFCELHKVRDLACFNCPVQCSKLYKYTDARQNRKFFEGLQANHLTNFGSMIDNDDPEVILEASALCNELGLDCDSVACGISWLFECFEKGRIKAKDCSGLDLSWGRGRTIPALIEGIAYRRGPGKVVSDGIQRAASDHGDERMNWAMTIKGAPLREINMQTKMAWALGIGVSTRGSGHLNGSIRIESLSHLNQSQLKVIGFKGRPDPDNVRDVAQLVAWFEDFKAAVDSSGICYFTTWWAGGVLGPTELCNLHEAVTGEFKDECELLKVGARIQNLEKAFNTIHGKFDRSLDYPPKRLFESSISRGKNQGAVMDRKKWEALLDEYYKARQYDVATGLQTKQCLKHVKLNDVSNQLQDLGKLID